MAEEAAPEEMEPAVTAMGGTTTAASSAMDGAATAVSTAEGEVKDEAEASKSTAGEGEQPWKAGPAVSAEKRAKAKAERHKPAPAGISTAECVLIGVLVILMVGALGVILYVMDAPLPWKLIGLGPPEHELSKETWDAKTEGKEVFVKFYAPWCGHCKSMASDWEKLRIDYLNSSVVTIASVDCIGQGSSLCTEVGVRGFPSLKYGDSLDVKGLSDYKGGRSYKALSEFAAKTFGPKCGPEQLDLCTEEQKSKVQELLALGGSKVQELIDVQVAELRKHEADFQAKTDGLTEEYNKAQKEKDQTKALLKEPLDLARSVIKFRASEASKPATPTAEL